MKKLIFQYLVIRYFIRNFVAVGEKTKQKDYNHKTQYEAIT